MDHGSEAAWGSVRAQPPLRKYLTWAALAACVVSISVAFDRVTHPIAQRLHLGAEYYNIGLALADGRGFSDPFGERTGPTAWMPPVYPALLGLIIRLVGSKNAVASVVVVLMTATVAVQAITVHAIARRCLRKLPTFVTVVIFFAWVLAFNYWFFLLTSDIWILSLLVNFATLALVDYVTTGRARSVAWGVLLGVGALTSPTFGVAVGALLLLFVFFDSAQRRMGLYSLVLAGAIVAPWVARNAVVFHKFIPTKSNLMFEAYQANVLDSDGVYDFTTVIAHPFNTETTRFEYSRLGETAFIARYGQLFRRELAARPLGVLKRVGRRAVAATVEYVPLSEKMDLPLQRAVLRGLYAVPFLILITAIGLQGPQRRSLRVLALLWAFYLVPYVVVAFYVRYFLPLTSLLVTLVSLGLDQFACRWASRRAARISSAEARALTKQVA